MTNMPCAGYFRRKAESDEPQVIVHPPLTADELREIRLRNQRIIANIYDATLVLYTLGMAKLFELLNIDPWFWATFCVPSGLLLAALRKKMIGF